VLAALACAAIQLLYRCLNRGRNLLLGRHHRGLDIAATAASAAVAAAAASAAIAPAVAATMATMASMATAAVAAMTTMAAATVAAAMAAAATAVAAAASIAATTAAESAEDEGRGLLLTAHEGDSNQREKQRKAKHNNSVHPKILQFLTGTVS
jgi:hypothetical protein